MVASEMAASGPSYFSDFEQLKNLIVILLTLNISKFLVVILLTSNMSKILVVILLTLSKSKT